MNVFRKTAVLAVMFLVLYSCSSDDTTMPEEEVGEEATLEAVTNEVLLFEFTPDTGNNTSRLQYQIRFSNPNDITINGFHRITTSVDGLESTTIASDRSSCYEIEGNSSCTLSFDEEISFDLGMIDSIKLISVEYVFEQD